MIKNKTLLFISYSTCPTFYVSKHMFHASLTEEYPQSDVITSELGSCILTWIPLGKLKVLGELLKSQ